MAMSYAAHRPSGKEIEIAASLDPTNPIVRSYLGKAYFEERRDPGPDFPLDFSKEPPKSLAGSQQ